MIAKPCRDCGYMLDVALRGCPQCALNVEAERMISRFVWRRLVPVVVIVIGVGVLLYLMR